MKISKIAISLLVSTLIFTGCGEDEDKDTSTRDGSSQQQEQNQQNIEQQEANERMGDVTKKDRGGMLWKYEFDKKSLVHSQVPAIDEKGNIYFSFNSSTKSFEKKNGKFTVVSLDKNGKERWVKTFKNIEGNPKIMYKNNQIFFLLKKGWNNSQTSIYSLNTSNGDVKWSVNEKNMYVTNYTAISNGKLYVHLSDLDRNLIVSYDLTTGSKKDTYQIDTSENQKAVYSMSMFNNHLYFLTLEGSSRDCITRVDDIDDTMTKSWETCDNSFRTQETKNDYENLYGAFMAMLAIDSKENIYFQGVTRVSEENQYVTNYSIDKNGEFRWRNRMDVYNILFPRGITIDKNDNIYSSVAGSGLLSDSLKLGFLYSLSSQGDENWRLKESYFDSGKILRMDYQYSPTLGSNGNIYSKVDYGLNAVKSNGTLDWKHRVDSGEQIVSSFSTINTDGNIIAIGLGGKIACYKGDSTTLESNGWSKLYGNAGNTSSR